MCVSRTIGALAKLMLASSAFSLPWTPSPPSPTAPPPPVIPPCPPILSLLPPQQHLQACAHPALLPLVPYSLPALLLPAFSPVPACGSCAIPTLLAPSALPPPCTSICKPVQPPAAALWHPPPQYMIYLPLCPPPSRLAPPFFVSAFASLCTPPTPPLWRPPPQHMIYLPLCPPPSCLANPFFVPAFERLWHHWVADPSEQPAAAQLSPHEAPPLTAPPPLQSKGRNRQTDRQAHRQRV